MIHERFGDQSDTQNTQSLAQPHLDRLQLSWEADVEDAYPIIGTTSFFSFKELINPHKRVYITSMTDPYELVAALKTTLRSWSSLRSIAVEYDQATRLVVVLRATQRYFDRAISIHTEDMEDEQALKDISMPCNHAVSELPRGLMFRMAVARVKSTKTVGLVIVVHHAVFDAASIIAWGKDLEALLAGNILTKRIPHKVFAEAFYLHQTSLAAKMSTEYHLQRLRGMGSLHDALWPPSHLYHNLPTRAGVPDEMGRVEAIEGAAYSGAEVIGYRRCRNLAKTAMKPSALLTAAMAIFNTSYTGSRHAILGFALAGREWPFMNDSLAQLLPSPMTIAGPTVTATVVVVKVDETESVSRYLERVETDLRLLRRHQHWPLDFPAHLDDADREMFYTAIIRQFLNYQPKNFLPSRSSSASATDSPLRLILDRDYHVEEESVNIFAWECSLEDAETLRIKAMFNPALFSKTQVEGFVETIFDIVDFLSENGNGEMNVGEMRAVLTPKKDMP